MDDIDIFQRCCIKDGLLDLQDDEVEIFDAESSEELLPEEEAPPEEEEEKLDLNALQRELECMKRRIQKLQLKLKMMQMEECPEEECVDFEVLLTCSKHKEICALQKNHHKLQCQINELIRCTNVAKDMIKDLRIRMCEKAREVLLLQKLVADLCVWRDTLAHEFGVCLERFEYIKHVKAEWQEVEERLEKQRQCVAKAIDRVVPKTCYVSDKRDFMMEVCDMKELFRQFFDLQSERFVCVEQRLRALEEAKLNVVEVEVQTLETVDGITVAEDASTAKTASN